MRDARGRWCHRPSALGRWWPTLQRDRPDRRPVYRGRTGGCDRHVAGDERLMPAALWGRMRCRPRYGHTSSAARRNQFTIAGDVRLTKRTCVRFSWRKGRFPPALRFAGHGWHRAPDEVLLAGALGNNFHQDSARAIGLVPDIPALRGLGTPPVWAHRWLFAHHERRRAELLAAGRSVMELARGPTSTKHSWRRCFSGKQMRRG